MSTLSTPNVVSYCNARLRPLATQFVQMIRTIDQVLTEVGPNAQAISAALAVDPTAAIEDGSPADGRSPVTCGDMIAVIRAAQVIQNYYTSDVDPATGQHTGITSEQQMAKVAVIG